MGEEYILGGWVYWYIIEHYEKCLAQRGILLILGETDGVRATVWHTAWEQVVRESVGSRWQTEEAVQGGVWETPLGVDSSHWDCQLRMVPLGQALRVLRECYRSEWFAGECRQRWPGHLAFRDKFCGTEAFWAKG